MTTVKEYITKLRVEEEAKSKIIAAEIAEIQKYHGKGEERTCTNESCWIIRTTPKDAKEPVKCGHSTDPYDRDGCLRFCKGDPFYIADFRLDAAGRKIWVRGGRT